MVEPAVLGAIDHIVTADAVLYPINQANVTPKISAPVKRVLVNRGDHVRAGQLIAELESGDLAAAVEEAKYQYQQAQAAYATVTGATVVEDETKAKADIQSAQSAFDAAKKLYDSRVALQKEGALAQKQVDETQLQMVQAQTQLETAQQHLKSLNGVGRQEAIRAAQAQMDAAKAHHDSAHGAAFLRADSSAPSTAWLRTVRYIPAKWPAAGMPLVSIVDISQLAARGQRAGERSRVHSRGPAGSRRRARRRHSGHGDRGQSRRPIPTPPPSKCGCRSPNPGEQLKPGAHGSSVDHRGNHPEHDGGSGHRAAQL